MMRKNEKWRNEKQADQTLDDQNKPDKIVRAVKKAIWQAA